MPEKYRNHFRSGLGLMGLVFPTTWVPGDVLHLRQHSCGRLPNENAPLLSTAQKTLVLHQHTPSTALCKDRLWPSTCGAHRVFSSLFSVPSRGCYAV